MKIKLAIQCSSSPSPFTHSSLSQRCQAIKNNRIISSPGAINCAVHQAWQYGLTKQVRHSVYKHYFLGIKRKKES